MSSQHSPYVIVGASMAGAAAAEALRTEGYDGPIVLIGDEADLPYERPPLSKEYLQGSAERSSFVVHEQSWYDEHKIELRLSTEVTGLDTAAHQITVADGSTLTYAKLLLTTGSSPRRITVPGADLDGVHYLRTAEDSDRIRAALSDAKRVVVVGGGWIGLETAAAARAAEVDVTVLESAQLPLLKVLGEKIAQSFADLHTAHGVHLQCGVEITGFTGSDGTVTGVDLADGTHLDADAIIVGVGISPNTGLAETGGLAVDNGITVDAALRSSDPDVFAAGDVANAFHPFLQRQLRVEHWANASYQPGVAAKSMLGQNAEYDQLPYFFSDQYDLGMEYTGYVEPNGFDDVVVRGSLQDNEYIAFWTKDGKVLAGMNVNIWDVTEAISVLITSGEQIDRDALADPERPLDSLTSKS